MHDIDHSETYLNTELRPDALVVKIRGDWLFENVRELEDSSLLIQEAADRHVEFRCDGLDEIDIAGAWVLYDRAQQLREL